MSLQACPLCGGSSLGTETTPRRWVGESVFGSLRGTLGLSRCRGCGLVFVNPRPSEELLGRFYSGSDYECHEPNVSAGAMRNAAAQLAVVRRFAPPSHGAKLLDYGCGGGYFLRHARESGLDAMGFDIGRAALEVCRRQGLPVTGSVDELRKHRFDAILLSHVFEHVVDPPKLLGLFVELLAPGGHLCLEVPNGSSLRARAALPVLSRHARFDERHRAFPIHLVYYSRGTLMLALRSRGWSIAGMTTTGLGLDELLIEPPAERVDPPPAPAPDRRGARSGDLALEAKRVFGRAFFDACLGENLFAVARPPERRVEAGAGARPHPARPRSWRDNAVSFFTNRR